MSTLQLNLLASHPFALKTSMTLETTQQGHSKLPPLKKLIIRAEIATTVTWNPAQNIGLPVPTENIDPLFFNASELIKTSRFFAHVGNVGAFCPQPCLYEQRWKDKGWRTCRFLFVPVVIHYFVSRSLLLLENCILYPCKHRLELKCWCKNRCTIRMYSEITENRHFNPNTGNSSSPFLC